MNAKPMPKPRTSIAMHSQKIEVCAPIRANGIVAAAVSITPNRASGPPPKRSVSLPESGMTSGGAETLSGRSAGR